MPLIRHNRFALFCMLAGILALAAISYLQSHFILGIPLALGNFIIPSLVGGITGLFIGRSYFRLQDRERALREAEGRLQTILESVHAGIILVDASSHTIVEANKAALQMLKGTRQQVVGAHCRHFFCPTEPEGCPITDLGQEADSSERLMRDLEGRQIPILKTATTVVIHGVPHLLESFVDITERKLAEQEIQQLAYYDTLTGLPNRALLKDRLQQALALSARENLLLAVIFLDLDHFKLVNDTLGHSNGDQLLRTVAERLQGCIRRSDTVARLGGDEFVAILEGISDTSQVASVAEKIKLCLQDELPAGAHRLRSSASIGISLFPDDADSAEDLMRYADLAMYRAKERGRNDYQFFTPDLKIVAS